MDGSKAGEIVKATKRYLYHQQWQRLKLDDNNFESNY